MTLLRVDGHFFRCNKVRIHAIQEPHYETLILSQRIRRRVVCKGYPDEGSGYFVKGHIKNVAMKAYDARNESGHP